MPRVQAHRDRRRPRASSRVGALDVLPRRHGGAATRYTTGNISFAVCHGHSAKPEKHSAKGLPSVTLSKELTTATVPANSVFAECFLSGTRQKLCRELKTTLGKKSTLPNEIGHGTFAECQILGTRQSLVVCRVSNFGPSANLSHLSCVKL